jgi:hypothetical protein
MPKVEGSCHIYKKMEHSETIILGILDHLLLLALFKDLEYYHWVLNTFLR